MGEEFYSIIKLISGEEIFALISIDHDQEDPIVILQNPLVMKNDKFSKKVVILKLIVGLNYPLMIFL